MFESLRSLSDHKILSETDAIIVQDRKLTLRLLVHLHEIERRKLYLKQGYASMFVYCTTHLRLSEPAAVRRIRTARCLARFPQLYALLETGEVNLTTISMVSKILKPENAGPLVARIRGKSRRQVEAIVAEYEPRTILPPDRVRTVVLATSRQTASTGQEFTVAGDGKKSSTVEPSTHEDRRAGDGERSPDATVSLSGQVELERHAVVQFTARETVLTKLERVRALASHRLPANASIEQLVEFLADYFTEREDPRARHERRETRKQNANSNPSPKASSARVIPTRVRDEVFVRDQGGCCYVGPNGKRCGSTHVLQIDHIKPVARGGAATIDNLRLLCAYHNRLEAERLLGRSGPRGGPSH